MESSSISKKKTFSPQLYKKVDGEYLPYSPDVDAFQLPSSGYWKVVEYSDGRGEFKQLPIDAKRPIDKLNILQHTEEVYQRVSEFVYEGDPPLYEVVRETLLSLEDINHQLTEERKND